MPNYPCTGQLLCAEIIARIRETVTSSSYAVISPIHTDTCSVEFHLITHPLNHCSRGNRDGYIPENNYALRPHFDSIYIYNFEFRLFNVISLSTRFFSFSQGKTMEEMRDIHVHVIIGNLIPFNYL